MAKILLGVTGSVAAIKTMELFGALTHLGHSVRIVATRAATYFFEPTAIASRNGTRDPNVISLDEDEWPGRDQGKRYQRGDEVLHIELRRWADLFLIAPLDANTLGKLATGLCDNCLTCVWRAWDPTRPVVLAPAMNTMMWQHPITRRQLRSLVDGDWAPGLDGDALLAEINKLPSTIHIVPPVSKLLACGDEGVGAMASVDAIVAAVEARLTSR